VLRHQQQLEAEREDDDAENLQHGHERYS